MSHELLVKKGLLFKNQQVIIVFTEGEHLVIFNDSGST